MKVLVCIASYGTANDRYLTRLLNTYRSMPYSTDIIVVSNIKKDLGDDISVVVGLPTKDPWSLPFQHKHIFADRVDQYDLYIYSEDDILITAENLHAFLRVSAILPQNEIVGFFRYEEDSAGNIFYPDAHKHFHWDVRSARSRDQYSFAFYTNEHSACYALTNEHLRGAIRSGGFLVEPHQGKYDLLVTAATDPYTQCGYEKLLCTSHFGDFLVHHLPNKYIGTLSLEGTVFECQIQAMKTLCSNVHPPQPLLETHPEFRADRFGKDYYEPVRNDLINLIPEGARDILSVGCGWGATEEALSNTGRRITAVPLDLAIASCAERRGVKVVPGDATTVVNDLSGQKFDCLIASNILHLVQDPGGLLALFSRLLRAGALAIVTVPNVRNASVAWHKLRGDESYQRLGEYDRSGVHPASRSPLCKWLKNAQLSVHAIRHVLPSRADTLNHATLGLFKPLLSSEIVAVAVKDV